MAKRGDNIHKRKDGRWEGRYKKGRRPDGSIQYGSVYGKSYSEVKKKLENILVDNTITPNGCWYIRYQYTLNQDIEHQIHHSYDFLHTPCYKNQ